MKRVLAILFTAVALTGLAPLMAGEIVLETEEQKTLYALGLAISQRVMEFDLSPAELAIVNEGLADGVLRRPSRVELDIFGPKVDGLQQERIAATIDRERAAGEVFVVGAAREPGAVQTDSGMVYIEITPGKGVHPKNNDTVYVHYSASYIDGTVFDQSSKGDADPVLFRLGTPSVIPCVTEGLQLMQVGGTAKLICPTDTAWGDRGARPFVPPGATVIFEIRLFLIQEEPTDAAG